MTQNQDALIKKLREENKKLQEEITHLNNGDERYKRLFDASPDIIIEVDKEETIIICHMPGVPQEQLAKVTGLNIFDVTPAVFHKPMKEALMKVLSTGEKTDYESEGETLGSYRYYYSHLSPIYNEKGEINSIYFISRDVTQQKVADQIIKESEKTLKALFDSSQHTHVLLSQEAQCLWFNKKADATTEMLFDKKLAVGKYDHECIPESFLPSFRIAFKKALAGETITYEREYAILKGGSGSCNIEFTLQPVYTRDNTMIGISMIGIDITERYLSEENLRKINKELVQQNTQLNQYSYIISHNLRGPIVTLLGLTDVFERFSTDATLQSNVIGHIKKSAIHLDNIIKDLNQILSNSEETELIKVPVDFEEEISVVKDLLKGQIEHANASIHTDFTAVKTITSVKSYIQSILLNLMSNSLKYKIKELPAIITIKTEKIDDQSICLSFADNGLGFDVEKNKEKIFGFYKRFHNHVEGKGLGLYLLKNQIEMLGGRVEVESEINKGTTFRLFLAV